jgi:hypothetical protein
MLARPTAAHAVTIIRPLESLAAVLSIAQPCHPGPRLFETNRPAYEAQARRVFAALISAAMSKPMCSPTRTAPSGAKISCRVIRASAWPS